MIDPKGLHNFRPDNRRRGSDPNETEGRIMYRARADAEARRSIASARKVKMKDPYAEGMALREKAEELQAKADAKLREAYDADSAAGDIGAEERPK